MLPNYWNTKLINIDERKRKLFFYREGPKILAIVAALAANYHNSNTQPLDPAPIIAPADADLESDLLVESEQEAISADADSASDHSPDAASPGVDEEYKLKLGAVFGGDPPLSLEQLNTRLLNTWNTIIGDTSGRGLLVRLADGTVFIQDPSQDYKIVSESVYWLRIASGAHKFGVPADESQQFFDDFLKGVDKMTELAAAHGSPGGFPAWITKIRNTAQGRTLILYPGESVDSARNSASDADHDYVDALFDALDNVRAGIWKDHGYAKRLNELIPWLAKEYIEQGGRYILNPSEIDDWNATFETGKFRPDYLSPKTCFRIAAYLRARGLDGQDWEKRGLDSWDLLLTFLKKYNYIPAQADIRVENGEFITRPNGAQSWDGIRGPWRMSQALAWLPDLDAGTQALLERYLQSWYRGYTVPSLDAAAYFGLAVRLGDTEQAGKMLERITAAMTENSVYADETRYYQLSLSFLNILEALYPEVLPAGWTPSDPGLAPALQPTETPPAPVVITETDGNYRRTAAGLGIAVDENLSNNFYVPSGALAMSGNSLVQEMYKAWQAKDEDRFMSLFEAAYRSSDWNYKETKGSSTLIPRAVTYDSGGFQNIPYPGNKDYGHTSNSGADMGMLAALILGRQNGWGENGWDERGNLHWFIAQYTQDFIKQCVESYTDENGDTKFILLRGGFAERYREDEETGLRIYDYHTQHFDETALQIIINYYETEDGLMYNNNEGSYSIHTIFTSLLESCRKLNALAVTLPFTLDPDSPEAAPADNDQSVLEICLLEKGGFKPGHRYPADAKDPYNSPFSPDANSPLNRIFHIAGAVYNGGKEIAHLKDTFVKHHKRGDFSPFVARLYGNSTSADDIPGLINDVDNTPSLLLGMSRYFSNNQYLSTLRGHLRFGYDLMQSRNTALRGLITYEDNMLKLMKRSDLESLYFTRTILSLNPDSRIDIVEGYIQSLRSMFGYDEAGIIQKIDYMLGLAAAHGCPKDNPIVKALWLQKLFFWGYLSPQQRALTKAKVLSYNSADCNYDSICDYLDNPVVRQDDLSKQIQITWVGQRLDTKTLTVKQLHKLRVPQNLKVILLPLIAIREVQDTLDKHYQNHKPGDPSNDDALFKALDDLLEKQRHHSGFVSWFMSWLERRPAYDSRTDFLTPILFSRDRLDSDGNSIPDSDPISVNVKQRFIEKYLGLIKLPYRRENHIRSERQRYRDEYRNIYNLLNNAQRLILADNVYGILKPFTDADGNILYKNITPDALGELDKALFQLVAFIKLTTPTDIKLDGIDLSGPYDSLPSAADSNDKLLSLFQAKLLKSTDGKGPNMWKDFDETYAAQELLAGILDDLFWPGFILKGLTDEAARLLGADSPEARMLGDYYQEIGQQFYNLALAMAETCRTRYPNPESIALQVVLRRIHLQQIDDPASAEAVWDELNKLQKLAGPDRYNLPLEYAKVILAKATSLAKFNISGGLAIYEDLKNDPALKDAPEYIRTNFDNLEKTIIRNSGIYIPKGSQIPEQSPTEEDRQSVRRNLGF